MMSTRNGRELRVRPMAASLERERNEICFLTEVRWHADDEIKQYPQLALAFADNGDQNYVAVSGRGALSNDRARIKELFSIPAKAWWDSADDPDIRLLTVAPDGAEYRNGRGKAASTISDDHRGTGGRSNARINEDISMS
jgi:general stress protein 26